ncbi:MAG: serine/threonine protein kinase [Myxococcales bacterium]|nr:serine/threonine protein kinase [Myxococcales bacterium]
MGATPSDSSALPRYRITGVLGRGGFGTVYLARLEDGSGFVKDVAIKILSDDDPPPDVLGRFRDEARMLGRLRDRNIVSVDPPVRLAGRWSVVMEYAAGTDCRRLLSQHGPLPPLIAAEIVQEVVRTLDNLWNHPADDGQPMHLVHRDLKPSNIQLTPDGSVKLLDFGVATARIVREVHTTNHITGTVGYIAPERLDGVEDHGGDIYSLGVVLEELVLGTRPVKPGDDLPDPDVDDATVLDVVRLARAMRSLEVPDRPSAAEVERRCRDLLKQHEGDTLRTWARTKVRPALVDVDDPLVGKVLVDPRRRPRRKKAPDPWATQRAMLAGLLAAAATLALLVLFATVGSTTLWGEDGMPPFLATTSTDDDPVDPPEDIEAADAATVEQPPPSAPPQPAAATKPRAAPPAPPPLPTPEPAPAPEPEPKPAPVRLAVTGDAQQLRLVGDAGSFGPSAVPPGRYTVHATFDGAEVVAGEIVVPASGGLALRCDRRFQRCVPL